MALQMINSNDDLQLHFSQANILYLSLHVLNVLCQCVSSTSTGHTASMKILEPFLLFSYC